MEERMKTIIRLAAAAAGLTIALGSVAWAQDAKPVRVRGTIEKVDGNTITAKLRDGSAATIKLADTPRITAMTKAQLSDIKEGSFIGVTAMPQPDGSQKAIGLHIFMDAQRGVVKTGFTPWDREPGSTMTNADVAHGQIHRRREEGDRPAQHAGGPLQSRHQGRSQAGRAVLHRRRHQAGGRDDRGARHQCRPRRRRAADVKQTSSFISSTRRRA
jgi:Cu/Ag efflux protein CusF